MRTVHVNLGSRSYDILVGPALLGRLDRVFTDYGIGRQIFLVSSRPVFDLFGEGLIETLQRHGFDVTRILIPDGERYKSLETVEKIYTYLIAQRADRWATLAALGGGVTGDIAGFVAATFLRGIPYVQIPTTLLAQVDSSVGGKTGVNHHLGKNLIGAFYQPHLVCLDPRALETLPQRQFQSGMYEVLKYGLIFDATFFERVTGQLERILRREEEPLEAVISRCCEIKAEIISIDEREQDLRTILNFGHTFGHALEAATDFRLLTHGEAVAYGMLAATRLSVMRGTLEAALGDRVSACIERLGPLPSLEGVATSRVLEAIRRDKKRHGDRVVLVLLDGVGRTRLVSDLDERALAKVWEETLESLPEAR